MWFPTAEETLNYSPVPTDITPGPTLYAAAHISSLSFAFDIFITEDITSLGCFRDDKLAVFHILWKKWDACLPLLFNPGVGVCVPVLYRYSPTNKPAKYTIKIWFTCDMAT